jgi:RNA polymerase sigma-70 factor (ECF subfamily)
MSASAAVAGHVNPGPTRGVYLSTELSTETRTELRGRRLLDEYAIREFLHTAYPLLVAAIGLLSGSRAVAEDAVQEGLARAWERSERGEDIRNLGAWVTTVALNLSRSGLRRLRIERRARDHSVARGSDEPSPLRVDVERSVAALPRRQREVVVLHYFLGLEVREIAEVLRVHDGTVKTSLHRARAALARSLGEPIEEEATDGER